MGFWTLFEVASMPILQVLLISILGAFMATNYCNLLTTDARRSLNKVPLSQLDLLQINSVAFFFFLQMSDFFLPTQIVFMLFTPSLMFASLAKTVTLQDIISW